MYAESIPQSSQTDKKAKPAQDVEPRTAQTKSLQTKSFSSSSITSAGMTTAQRGAVIPFNTFASVPSASRNAVIQPLRQPMLAPSFEVSGSNLADVSREGINDTVQLMSDSHVIQRGGETENLLTKFFPNAGLGTQLIYELGKNALKKEVFDQLMQNVIIPILRLDPLLKSGVDWAKDKIMTFAVPYIGWLKAIGGVIKAYTGLSEEARAAIKYLIGVVLNYVRRFISWVYEKVVGSQPSYSGFWVIESILAADGTTFVSGVQKVTSLAQGLLSENPATELFRQTKDYLWEKLTWLFGGSASSDEGDGDGEGEGQVAPPPVKGLKAGPLTMNVHKFGIQTESEDKKLGVTKKAGLSTQFSASMSLFGKTISIGDGDNTAEVRLDWDRNFMVDYNGGAEGKKIVPDFNLFNLVSTKGVYLDRLIVGNEGLKVFSAHIKTLNFNNYLSAEKVSGSWDPTGFTFVAEDLTMALPELTETKGRGTVHVKTKADGSFESLKVINASIGELTMDGAYLDKEKKSFKMTNMRYPLPEPVNNFTAVLSILDIDNTGLKEIKGGVNVKEWKPIDWLEVNGALMVGWKDKKVTGELNNVALDVNAGPISGSANLKLLRLTFGDISSLKGDLTSFSFGVGPLSFLANNATFDHRSLGVKTASMVLATNDKAAIGEVEDIEASNSGELLQKLKAFSGAVKVTANDISYAKGKGFKVGSYETKLIMPAISVSLFGGMLKGAINPEDKSAQVSGQVTLPPSQKFWPGFGISLPIHPTPLMLFVDTGLRGGITATITAKLNKPADPKAKYAYQGSLNGGVNASLEAYLQGGVKIGADWIAALRAYLEASAGFSAKGNIDGNFRLGVKEDGSVGEKEGDSEQYKPELNFDFAAGLSAGVAFKVDLKTFITETKELYKYNLKTWELGMADVKGKVTTDDKGKFKLIMEKPNKDGEAKTLGGALRSEVKTPENFLEPLSPKEALATIDSDKKISNKATFRLVSEILDPVWGYHEVEQQQLLAMVRVRAKEESVFNKHVEDSKRFKKQRSGDKLSYIMKNREWIQFSTTKGLFSENERKSIKDVDLAIIEYHSIDIANITSRLAGVNAIQESIKKYNRQSGKSRKAMTNFLWKQTVKEKELLNSPEPESLDDITQDFAESNLLPEDE